MGLSCGSKHSVFGWICDLPEVACPLKKNGKKKFFIEKMDFKETDRH